MLLEVSSCVSEGSNCYCFCLNVVKEKGGGKKYLKKRKRKQKSKKKETEVGGQEGGSSINVDILVPDPVLNT